MIPLRTFPDAALCRTRHVDGDVYRCLASDACRCPYVLAFALNYYCRHPDNRSFSGKEGGLASSRGATTAADDAPWQIPAYAGANFGI